MEGSKRFSPHIGSVRLDDLKRVDEYTQIWRTYMVRKYKDISAPLQDNHYIAPLFWPPFAVGDKETVREVFIRRIQDLRGDSVRFLEEYLKCLGEKMVDIRIMAPVFDKKTKSYEPPKVESCAIPDPVERHHWTNGYTATKFIRHKRKAMVFAVYITAGKRHSVLNGRINELLALNDPNSEAQKFTNGTALLGIMDVRTGPFDMKAMRPLKPYKEATVRFDYGVADFKHPHKEVSISEVERQFRFDMSEGGGPSLNPTAFAWGHCVVLTPDACVIMRSRPDDSRDSPFAIPCDIPALLHNLVPLEMGFLPIEACFITDPGRHTARYDVIRKEKTGPKDCSCSLCKEKMLLSTKIPEGLDKKEFRDAAWKMSPTSVLPEEEEPYRYWRHIT